MYIYDIEMAPVFLQILKDQEATQHEILRDKGDTFKGKTSAITPSIAGVDKFGRAARELKSLPAARHRIDIGGFGTCEACAAVIDLQRLISLHIEKGEPARNGAYDSATRLGALQSHSPNV